MKNHILFGITLLAMTFIAATDSKATGLPVDGYGHVLNGHWMGTGGGNQNPIDPYCDCAHTPTDCNCQFLSFYLAKPNGTLKPTEAIYPCSAVVDGNTITFVMTGIAQKMHPPLNQLKPFTLSMDTCAKLKLKKGTQVLACKVKLGRPDTMRWTYQISSQR